MTDEQLNEPTAAGDPRDAAAGPEQGLISEPDGAPVATDATAADALEPRPDLPAQYGVGPFTVRELSLAGVWVLAFVFSFFPLYRAFEAGPSVWTSGIDWILTIGLPTVAVFLIVLRRFSPQGIRRVGSLGIDQFASVAFSVSAVVWVGTIWNAFAGLPSRLWGSAWVAWVELVLMLAGVVLTVFARVIPVFDEDFQGRPETIAHVNARPVRALAPRPARVAPAHTAAAAPAGAEAPRYQEPVYQEPAYQESAYQAPADAADGAALHDAQAPVTQAFWALVPEERDVVDENGTPLFRIGPTAWALVIEERGSSFVVRHEDGRVGYLHDVSGVTRG